MDLCKLSDIKQLLTEHGFRFSKSMGQNFLICRDVPLRIAESAGLDKDACVLEVGPGIGCLTQHLSRLAKTVTAVELDSSLIPVLAQTMSDFDNVTVIHGDILKTDIAALCQKHFGASRAVVCANLPYNITSPVLSAFIESGCFQSITVMVQKEVAQRICSKPGSPEYGAFTVFCNYHTEPSRLFDVPAQCFYPQPKVTSCVIRLDSRTAPPSAVKSQELFFKAVRAAFAQRRKTLVNGLYSQFGNQFSKETIARVITECGFPDKTRGETLGIGEFANIANSFYDLMQKM